jgi:hypothetical protein
MSGCKTGRRIYARERRKEDRRSERKTEKVNGRKEN